LEDPLVLHRPQPAGYLVAVDAGQADVEQHDVRSEFRHELKGLDSAVGDCRFVPERLEEYLQRGCGVDVVVDDEHAAWPGLWTAGNARRGVGPRRSRRCARQRNAQGELASLVFTFARGGQCAMVELGDLA